MVAITAEIARRYNIASTALSKTAQPPLNCCSFFVSSKKVQHSHLNEEKADSKNQAYEIAGGFSTVCGRRAAKSPRIILAAAGHNRERTGRRGNFRHACRKTAGAPKTGRRAEKRQARRKPAGAPKTGRRAINWHTKNNKCWYFHFRRDDSTISSRY